MGRTHARVVIWLTFLTLMLSSLAFALLQSR
jgi:hypothetical protein